MRRREFIAFLGGVVLAPCFAAEAQQETRVWRIGYLASSTKEENIALLAGFHAGLKELDYVEEQNLKIEYRFAEMDLSRLKSLAADLVAQNVDVIVATTPHAAQAAMSITRTTPIIVLTASDPVAWGLAQSLARSEEHTSELQSRQYLVCR